MNAQNPASTAAFLTAVIAALGADAVNASASERADVGRHTLPAPDHLPAAVLYPASTAEVETIVKLANTHRVALFPISTGRNLGLGSRAPMATGQVVIELGKRMNRIVEINDDLGYAVVEPGVTFNAMYDELTRRGSALMMSPTAGPPAGSLLGNAVDKGGGAGPLGSHFDRLPSEGTRAQGSRMAMAEEADTDIVLILARPPRDVAMSTILALCFGEC